MVDAFLQGLTSSAAALADDPLIFVDGARLERIDAVGDPSAEGIAQKAGPMVNYACVPKDIEQNRAAHAKVRRIVRRAPADEGLRYADAQN